MCTTFFNNKKTLKNPFIDTIIDTVLNAKLEDWEHFSKKDRKLEIPFNINSGKHYNGLNLIKLMFHTYLNGYTSAYYLTNNQAFKVGGDIKGEKTAKIHRFQPCYRLIENTSKTISIEAYNKLKEEKQKLYKKSSTTPKFFVVNFDQIKNIDDIDKSDFKLEIPQFEVDFDINEEAEKFFLKLQNDENVKMILNRKRTLKAFYNLSNDQITLPETGIFRNDSAYYSTAFHEIIHWTGHPKRLNRLGFSEKGKKDELSYSYEELVAELGALLLCMEFKIYDTFLNTCSYLKGWLSATDKDKREETLKNAFIEASTAKKYLTNI